MVTNSLLQPAYKLLVQYLPYNARDDNERLMGIVQDCKWWQIEPGASSENLTLGLCIEEQLQSFQLRVSGNSGCSLFVEGKPAHAKGSSAAPPTAKPQR